ncbi:MAG: hypothetical protein ACR2MU_00265 [Gaiellaceae bacterium]
MDESTLVDLPPQVTGAFEVFVGGVPQVRGRDYELDERTLVFTRALAHEGRLGFWRWTSIFFGVAGTYRKNEPVDIVYERAGRRLVAQGVLHQRVSD